MLERTILHSDANGFYASVEMLLNPELRGKAVAVCGSTEERHGIVLAKSERAKKAGVKTGMANWEARKACPGLITVPPQYDQYCKFSRLLRNIYLRYTDLVEPYGMDECWLDVTGSTRLCGSGESIAEEIRKTVREELGITVSIGVSFNKIFAKLGSDMKKPDAVTVLDKANWRERIWPLPVSELLYVGRATTRKLMSRCVYTIGDLAQLDPELLRSWFGKNGLMLWAFANGEDTSRVKPDGYEMPIKSVGHGITCSCDLHEEEEVWKMCIRDRQSGCLLNRRVIQHEPLGFHDYNCLQMNAFCVVSDSGTLPEESSFFTSVGHPFPAVCIRTSTERPEALDKGCFILAGIDTVSLLQAVDTAVTMNQNGDHGIPVPDYVEENVSTKVVKIIQSYTGVVNKMVWRKD